MLSYRLLFFPAMLCACALLIALLWGRAAGLHNADLLGDYFQVSPLAAVLVFLLWCGLPFLRPSEYRGLPPSQAAVDMLRARWPLLLFPFFLSPLFNFSYTVAKSSIPYLYGFHWEAFWAGLDQRLFGTDPWRLTHAFIGPGATRILSICYTIVWGGLFVFSGPVLNFFAPVETALRFHIARMITWFFGGALAAALFASAGPVFAQFGDPQLGGRYLPLLQSLATLLPSNDMILESQAYLRETYGNYEVFRAGGISAMPSMHVATAALYVCVAWGSRWQWPTLAFWAVIWVSSVHFGYHYATDGLGGSLIAWLAWKAAAPAKAGLVIPTPDLQPSPVFS